MSEQQKLQYGYELAFRIACERIAGIQDIQEQCKRSDTQYLEEDSRTGIIVEYLHQLYFISLSDVEFSGVDGESPVSIKDKILMLDYFTQAKGTPITNTMIPYKELPGGANYLPVFTKRTIKPLTDFFGEVPHQLIKQARMLGGRKADIGDVAVTINAFRRVPITLVLWRGDEEFSPGGNILFDSTVMDYLTTDDVNALCETIVWRLVRQLKAGGENTGSN